MKEATLRKWHRKMGVLLAVFIGVQAISGLGLSLDPVVGLAAHSHVESEKTDPKQQGFRGELFEFVHHGAGPIGGVYRIALALGVLWMVVTGSAIYLQIGRRTTRA